jgi:hypothetical protein
MTKEILLAELQIALLNMKFEACIMEQANLRYDGEWLYDIRKEFCKYEQAAERIIAKLKELEAGNA